MIAFHLMLLRRAAQQDCLVPREGGTFAEGCGIAAQQDCVVTRECGTFAGGDQCSQGLGSVLGLGLECVQFGLRVQQCMQSFHLLPLRRAVQPANQPASQPASAVIFKLRPRLRVAAL